jgi:putative colanic acid biosynthesis acetyltransferase WcaF
MRFYSEKYTSGFSISARGRRLLWEVVWALLFRPSPWFLFCWRRTLLRLFGASIAANVRIYPSVRIWAPWNISIEAGSTIGSGVDCYSVDRIDIGSEVTVSQRAFLCTASHDLDDPERHLRTKPIRLGSASWVFAEAFIGPGVMVREGAVVAARAVVVKDVAPWSVVAGNPARVVKTRRLRKVG